MLQNAVVTRAGSRQIEAYLLDEEWVSLHASYTGLLLVSQSLRKKKQSQMPLVIDPKALGFLVVSAVASTIQGDSFHSILALAGFTPAKVGKPSKRRVETGRDAHDDEESKRLWDVFSLCSCNKKQSTCE